MCKIFQDRPIGELSPDSENAFTKLADTARRENKPILFYVHGYNNKITSALRAAAKMRERYNCEVIPFLWPTEGRLLKYGEDREDAEMSARPLLRSFSKVWQYLDKAKYHKQIILMCHSMGNYVLQNAVRTRVKRSAKAIPDLLAGKVTLGGHQRPSPLFKHVILTAADVDSKNHVDWVKRIVPGGKVFIFINTDDDTLKLSDKFAGRFFLSNSIKGVLFGGSDHPPRLGQTLEHIKPTSKRIYVNVNVGMKHALDVFQFMQLEHSYHKDGKGEIEAFYKLIISGLGTERERRKLLSKYNARQGYYSIKGWSGSEI